MIQFYFLAVAINVLVGVLLAFNNEDSSIGKIFDVSSGIFQMVIGILSVLVGFFKLLSPVGQPVVFGDFFIVLTSFLGGGSMLVSYFSEKSTTEPTFPSIVNTIFVENKQYIGYACILFAVLHFICPGVVLL